MSAFRRASHKYLRQWGKSENWTPVQGQGWLIDIWARGKKSARRVQVMRSCFFLRDVLVDTQYIRRYPTVSIRQKTREVFNWSNYIVSQLSRPDRSLRTKVKLSNELQVFARFFLMSPEQKSITNPRTVIKSSEATYVPSSAIFVWKLVSSTDLCS